MTVRPQLQTVGGLLGLLMPALASAQGLSSEHRLAIWIIGLGVLVAVPVVAISLFAQYLTMKRRADLIEKFLEHGREIPPEVLAKPEITPPSSREIVELNRSKSMRGAVVLLALALGLALAFYIGSGNPRAAAWGVPFLCLGLASFINAKYFSGSRSVD